jgi:hypothetical protein
VRIEYRFRAGGPTTIVALAFVACADFKSMARRRLLAGASRFGARVTSIQPAFGR